MVPPKTVILSAQRLCYMDEDHAPSMYVKKNATAALDVGFCTDVPLNESKMAIIIMEKPQPIAPNSIGLRRPTLSANKVG